MSDNDSTIRITLRIPADLHEDLVKAASEDNRSMNAEIIQRLRDSLGRGFAVPTHSDLTHAQPLVSKSKKTDIDLYTLAEVLAKTIGKWDPKTIENLQKITTEITKWDPDKKQ
ncbi:hypothetical protein GGR41_000576 [Paenalcaligenes hominis]|uniref:Arc-like DNA binding domain-containing protein n=1 Tax=Paenalcaligenes hominis TaxID=643674 RepID=A0ABX0WNM8_9BURK|nr:Arc family DNA-binding protein [Paenalcaligenes hominis]NJB64355.1 hypothetical protein [Paenalcaligenes hominis]GGE68282.1 hypothetical protein GCM10007278_15460 [Paenalcaligenes hominis]